MYDRICIFLHNIYKLCRYNVWTFWILSAKKEYETLQKTKTRLKRHKKKPFLCTLRELFCFCLVFQILLTMKRSIIFISRRRN